MFHLTEVIQSKLNCIWEGGTLKICFYANVIRAWIKIKYKYVLSVMLNLSDLCFALKKLIGHLSWKNASTYNL